ncbi:MAG: hypothetical protein QOG34_1803, partial [Frankiaceae bacterium]|nr:hypothetical protein [Frankiaceae bacterium]
MAGQFSFFLILDQFSSAQVAAAEEGQPYEQIALLFQILPLAPGLAELGKLVWYLEEIPLGQTMRIFANPPDQRRNRVAERCFFR